LGVMQSNFSAFTKAAMNYDNFLSLNLINQEKNALHRQIADRKIYYSNLNRQLEMKKKELNIAKSTYEREKTLYGQKIISEYDRETAEQAYLNKQQEVQQLQTSISLENVESGKISESASKLSVQYLQEKRQLFTELQSSYRELVTAVENWQQTYLLIASQAGTLSFNTFWKQNQYINTGDKVFAVVSQKPGALIGKITVTSSGSGKIHTGQSVNIKVAGYPYLEYGILQGKIRNISLVTNNDHYTVEVNLYRGLRSSINKELKFTGELNGTAEIVIENQSLMERMSTPVKYLAKKFFKH